MRIVSIADTHGLHRAISVPDGDVLVHAGDITNMGALDEVEDFNEYVGGLSHRHKIVVAGNHDFCFERDPRSAALLTNCIYLQDESVTIEGIVFYGSPWQPWFYDWAFNLERGPEIREKWDLIPGDVGVLITHGPPFGHGDATTRGERVGCRDLMDAIERARPRLHVFGHIHEGAGTYTDGHTTFVNASCCDRAYRPVNRPIVYDWTAETTEHP